MAVIARKTTTYRWICTNKELCAQVDEQIATYLDALGRLSSFVASNKISGLDCVRGEAKLTLRLKDLRDARKTLWRRVPVVTEEVELKESIAQVDASSTEGRTGSPEWKPEPYVSPYPKPEVQ